MSIRYKNSNILNFFYATCLYDIKIQIACASCTITSTAMLSNGFVVTVAWGTSLYYTIYLLV